MPAKKQKVSSTRTARKRDGKRPRGKRSAAGARPRAARAAIEEVRRAPLEPEVPVNPDAPLAAFDIDALEVLNETQALAPEKPDGGLVGQPEIDRERGIRLTGGDVDAAWDETDVGEETVGGSTPTPDQDVVDDLGRAAGVTYSDSEPLRPEEKEALRDEHRWEVDPASAEDYPERVRELYRRGHKTPRGRPGR